LYSADFLETSLIVEVVAASTSRCKLRNGQLTDDGNLKITGRARRE